MKIFFIVVGCVLLFSAADFAESVNIYKVWVDCSNNGPLYSGTLQVPSSKDFSCSKRDGDYAVAEDIKAPIILSFNERVYRWSPGEGSILSFSNKSCDLNKMDGVFEEDYFLGKHQASAAEQHTNKTLVFDMESSGNGFEGILGQCSFKTKVN